MNSVQDIIAEMNEKPTKKEPVSKEWLVMGEDLVKTEDCKKCNGTGWISVDEPEKNRGVARVSEKAIYIDSSEIEKVEKDLGVVVYRENSDFDAVTTVKSQGRYFYLENVTEQKCDCVLKRIARETFMQRIEESGLQTQLATKTFKTYKVTNNKQKAILEKCILFSKNPQNMLALLGQTGAGKTHLGTAVVGNLVYEGYTASYVEWQNEMNIARDDYYKVKQSKLDEWKSVDVLYIDDLFKNKDNDINLISSNEFNVAWDIIDHRLKRDMITIISSEFTIEEFIELDEGTGSRLNEMAGEYLLPIDKDPSMNYRLKNIR